MKKIMFNDKYGLTEAVLSGRKTETRRIEFDVYLQTKASDADAIGYGQGCCEMWWDGRILHQIPSRYKIGEVVAVAQCYYNAGWGDNIPITGINENGMPTFASESGIFNKMFVRADLMPHRIRITDVKVERLQDISEAGCVAEGILKSENGYSTIACMPGSPTFFNPRFAYAWLIDKVSGKGTWESNPYVFAYEFELIK